MWDLSDGPRGAGRSGERSAEAVAASGAWRYALPESYLVVALGRLGQPEDIAAATLVLASPASSWITGVTLDIAAGKIMP